MQKYKKQILISAVSLIILIFAFWYGGDAPSLRGWRVEEDKTVVNTGNEQVAESEEPQFSEDFLVPTDVLKEPVNSESEVDTAPEIIPEEIPEAVPEIIPDAVYDSAPENNTDSEYSPDDKQTEPKQQEAAVFEFSGDTEYSQNQGMSIDEDTGKDEYNTAPVPEGKPVPAEPEEAAISNNKLSCTLTVRCDTILDNIEWLDPEKKELIPPDGVILTEQTVTFYEGESVFNVLLREMKRNKIHFEYVNTPIYNSAYIEGINNIYEFDCGERSGWMYKVNDWFPNYGCSRYVLQDGDRIQILFTCNLGADLGE